MARANEVVSTDSFQLRLPKKTLRSLLRMAKETHRTRSQMVAFIIDEALSRWQHEGKKTA